MRQVVLVKKESTQLQISNHQELQQRLAERSTSVVRSLKPRTSRDEAINSQLWKCANLARIFSNLTGLPYSEIYSEASYSVCRIYENWDASRGANLSTYVNRCLKLILFNYLRDKSRLVKLPRDISATYLKINRARKANPDATLEEISFSTGVPLDKLEEALVATQVVHSLDIEDSEDNY